MPDPDYQRTLDMLRTISDTLGGRYVDCPMGFPLAELPIRDARGHEVCVGTNMDPSPDARARFCLYTWHESETLGTLERIIGFYRQPADVVAAARSLNPNT